MNKEQAPITEFSKDIFSNVFLSVSNLLYTIMWEEKNKLFYLQLAASETQNL